MFFREVAAVDGAYLFKMLGEEGLGDLVLSQDVTLCCWLSKNRKLAV